MKQRMAAGRSVKERALSFLAADDYNAPWDAFDEMDILRMNLWEYAHTLGLDETPFETHAAQGRVHSMPPITPISQSVEQDHGMALFYPLAGVLMDETLSGEQHSTVWHMACWTVFSLGAYALYAVCRHLDLSRVMASTGPLFLLLSPCFFAQGHYNKDIALFTLVLCVLGQTLRLVHKPTMGTAVIFAAFGALAANAKVAGMAVWGAMWAVCPFPATPHSRCVGNGCYGSM